MNSEENTAQKPGQGASLSGQPLTPQDHVDEYRRQGHAKVAEEQTSFGTSDDEHLLQWCESGEAGDAKFFITMYRDQYVKDHATGLWSKFKDHYWIDCELDEPLAAFEAVIEAYADLAHKWFWRKMNASKAGKEKEVEKAEGVERTILKKISLLQKRRHRENVLVLAAAGLDSLGITGREWDSQPGLLPFVNGVYELGSRIFRPGRPDDYVKTFCPFLGWGSTLHIQSGKIFFAISWPAIWKWLDIFGAYSVRL